MIKYIAAVILFLTTLNSMGMPSTYYKIENSTSMKKYFFTYMSKIANTQNRYILNDRNFIKSFYHKRNTINKAHDDYKKFEKIQKRYKLKPDDKLSKYLLYIDIIPVSLVIAQAAVESAWGKSRFIKEANNVFGQWTWSGKGLIPNGREAGKKHKIKIFSSIDSSVNGYMINLNIGWAYEDLRAIRAKIRKYGAPLSGLALSKTLIKYSQKKEEYTRILATIIVQNHLERFD
ncbi:MAG: glucosaminidase domain-containing protein [Arcobacteraceae bacterium]|nr:glucosaminidase domain-containing protein [Arcobacteraceae bacterium]